MPRPRPVYPEGMKKCSACKELKPMGDFSPASATYDKRAGQCKPCALESTKKWLLKKKAYGEYEEVKRKRREGMKKWRLANKPEADERSMQWSYGIGWPEYTAMSIAQDGKCAICGTTKPGGNAKRFHIDHCHDTKEVRGLLCTSCNQGIGRFKHLPHVLEKAAAYLRNPPNR